MLQIDEAFIDRLLQQAPAALAQLSITLLNDLKEARERLNQNPFNSSRPSGSLPPWDKGNPEDGPFDLSDADEVIGTGPDNDDSGETDDTLDDGKDSTPASTDKPSRHKPGRQPNSPGFGRTRQLAITDTRHHHCDVCQADPGGHEKVYTGFYNIDVEFSDESAPGVRLTCTHHLYYSAQCPHCGLENRSEPWRAPEDAADWKNVGMTEWRLVGPALAALIVYLSMEMRITRRKVQLLLLDVFGLHLSIGTIQNCLVESARTLAPVENQIVDELLSGSLMHAVYQAREGPDQGKVSIAAHHQDELESLHKTCEAMAVSSHKKTRELGREFLNDWEAIFRVLECPAWPLTNNEAERALRHWVIMRKITQGTRSEQGSRALAMFASVITT